MDVEALLDDHPEHPEPGLHLTSAVPTPLSTQQKALVELVLRLPPSLGGEFAIGTISIEHRARGADNLLRRLWRASGGPDFDPV